MGSGLVLPERETGIWRIRFAVATRPRALTDLYRLPSHRSVLSKHDICIGSVLQVGLVMTPLACGSYAKIETVLPLS